MTPAQRAETLADLDRRNIEDEAKRLFYRRRPASFTGVDATLSRQPWVPLQRRQMRSPDHALSNGSLHLRQWRVWAT
jgi:hypothetical protein